MRIRSGPATVTGEQPRRRPRAHARKAGARDDPGARTLPRTPRTASPTRIGRKAPPWVLLLSTSDTDLLSRARVGRGLPARQPGPARRRRPARPPRRRRPRRRAAPRRRPRLARRAGRRCRAAGAAGGRAGRRAGPRRRADGAVHGARGRRRGGAHLPRAGRPGQPRPAARLPLRHGPVHRPGLRPARRAAVVGDLRSAPTRAHRTGRSSPSSTTGPSSCAGNTAYVEALCAALEDAGAARCRSTAPRCARPSPRCCDTLAAADAMVVTVLAAGGTKPAGASAGGDDEAWDVGRARRARRADPAGPLPHHQPRDAGRTATRGCPRSTSPPRSPCPEFDGRLITVPFSFKEFDADGLTVYVPDPERAARVAGIAVRHARLRHIPQRAASGSC